MSLAKSEGSSNLKGKENVVDEAPHSELNCSKEEEATRDPDSECPSLIDQWYDTHSHFPIVPSDYSPPLPGHVWLSLEQRNFDISRAPLATSIPDLSIHQGETLPGLIFFEFRSGRLEGVG